MITRSLDNRFRDKLNTFPVIRVDHKIWNIVLNGVESSCLDQIYNSTWDEFEFYINNEVLNSINNENNSF